jgi:hypothetical protein
LFVVNKVVEDENTVFNSVIDERHECERLAKIRNTKNAFQSQKILF